MTAEASCFFVLKSEKEWVHINFFFRPTFCIWGVVTASPTWECRLSRVSSVALTTYVQLDFLRYKEKTGTGEATTHNLSSSLEKGLSWQQDYYHRLPYSESVFQLPVCQCFFICSLLFTRSNRLNILDDVQYLVLSLSPTVTHVTDLLVYIKPYHHRKGFRLTKW